MLDCADRTDRPQQREHRNRAQRRRTSNGFTQREDRRGARYRRQLRSGWRPGRDPADVPPGDALGAAFRAQLDQQLCGLVLLDAEMARVERPRPRGDSRDEPPRDGDRCLARLRRGNLAGHRHQHRPGGRDASRTARRQRYSAQYAGLAAEETGGQGRRDRFSVRQRVPQPEGFRLGDRMPARRSGTPGHSASRHADSVSTKSTSWLGRSFPWCRRHSPRTFG